MNSRIFCCITTSSPIVGSSRNSTSGWCSSAAASSHFIRSPSESLRTWTSSSGPRSSRSASSSERSAVLGVRDAVDLLVEQERLGGRQVPPELVLLAEHQREPALERPLALERLVPEHADAARRSAPAARPSSSSVVVLPAPFGPRNPTSSPRRIVRLTSSTARTSVYVALEDGPQRG